MFSFWLVRDAGSTGSAEGCIRRPEEQGTLPRGAASECTKLCVGSLSPAKLFWSFYDHFACGRTVRFSMSLARQFGELRHGAVEHTPAMLVFGAFEFTAAEDEVWRAWQLIECALCRVWHSGAEDVRSPGAFDRLVLSFNAAAVLVDCGGRDGDGVMFVQLVSSLLSDYVSVEVLGGN